MFEEGQLYAPVTEDENGVTVHLTDDHPGANDPEYRRRREVIAGPALRWSPGDPVPQVDYTPAENEIWRTVCAELAPKHERLAIRGYLEGKEALGLPTDRVPQLDEVSAGLERLSGFRLHPAAGLVPLDQFYGSLADGVFHSTQYLRHGSQPLYTPEPDIIHEVVGHGNLLANPAIAEVKRRAGEAARRCETAEGLQFVADVFWFTIEFGVMYEDGELRAYGAGLLSSYGEIEEFRGATVLPLDFYSMGTVEYDISHYQPTLFACDGMNELTERVGQFFAEFDDETPGRLLAARHRSAS
ncbi:MULTISPECIES: phenylalanine 4-monooxygenase [unclassified Isoptericola]|uniref:phenylalanine 4-monooxygenase n=1 Tax=unclassified Isoptericola TaxID=2623355 RepID=UPI003664DD71